MQPGPDVLCARTVSRGCATPDGARHPAPCRGDSGSGLIAARAAPTTCAGCCDQWEAIGIDSFSEEFCGRTAGSSTAYISTLHHMKWLLSVVQGRQEDQMVQPLPRLRCHPLLAGQVCCGPCRCQLFCKPGHAPRHEDVSYHQKCFGKAADQVWLPSLGRLQCVPGVTVVAGGWSVLQSADYCVHLLSDRGLDEGDGLLGLHAGDNRLGRTGQWTELTSVEVFAPAGGCNRALAPLPGPARRPVLQVN